MPRFVLLTLAVISLLVVSGCGNDKAGSSAKTEKALADAQPAASPAETKQPSESSAMHGVVLETMNAGSYTYVQVRTADGDVWAAGPTTKVAVGDEVTLPQGMLMQDFESPSLARKFPQIYFVNAIQTSGAAVPPGHAATPAREPGVEHTGAVMGGKAVTAGSVARADGGRTIAEIHAGRAGLGGQQVKVRGRVVKATMSVMGRNWLHIQDGSAEGPQGDLTVTTAGAAKVGDLVLVEGVAAVDRDFGSGYRYEVLVENATVTVESR